MDIEAFQRVAAVRARPDEEIVLSVVVPMYNEEAMVELFAKTVGAVLDPLPHRYELVFVDDGSRDRTRQLLSELAERDPHVRVIALSRNHGHQQALTAGVQLAQGHIVITMDGDLQHPPSLIPGMLEQWRAGAEVVQMVKQRQEKRGWLKTTAAKIFYRWFRRIASIDLDENASDFRLFGSKALSVIRQMGEQERFLRGMASWIGFHKVNIPYVAPPRAAGEPKYTLRKLGTLAMSGILSFSTVPLRLTIYFGLAMAAFAFIYGSHAILAKIFGDNVPVGWTDIVVTITGLAGVQLLFLGIIGTYVGSIYNEVKGRPLFIVDEVIGYDDPPRPPDP